MSQVVLQQIPLPDKKKFNYGHKCSKCKNWGVYGILTYSDKLEKTIFICGKCQPTKLIPAPLPTKLIPAPLPTR